jgi:hypothetical protein
MRNGISELTIATPRTPNGDTNFPMATSKMFIAVECLLYKLEQPSTGIPKSKVRRHNSGRESRQLGIEGADVDDS